MSVNERQKTHQYEILVVDDTPASLQLLTDILTGHGYRVRPAIDGRLALQSIAARRPDLILLDVKMTDINGYEVCRRLKSDEQSRKIPVIFISALGETSEKVEGFKAGGVDYITKPFQRDEVLARVGTHLRLWELTEQLEQKVSRRTADLTTANQQLRKEIAQRRRAEEEIAWNLAINQALSSLYIPLVTTDTSIEQIANVIVERSRQLTGSAYGYVAEIDPATGDLIVHTNTRMVQAECRVAEEQLRKVRFPQRADGLYNGLWGHSLNTKEPFYTDAPVKHPASVGTPEGHLAIESFLAVPVLLAGELIGQIALSNSTRAYTDRDLDAINRIAEFYALAIQQKRAEAEIRKLNNELERRVANRTAQLETANKELETFVYSASHDLRAPLRGIDGFSQILLEEHQDKLDAQGKDYLQRIRSAAQRMAQLIDDLLGLFGVSRRDMTVQKVNLSRMVREIADNLQKADPERQVEFVIHEGIKARGDDQLLRLVLENLMGNAWKFTSKHPTARIEFGLQQQEERPVYFIRDDGAGFDMKYAQKLFRAFQRLHTPAEFPGTGVGLVTVQRIIHRHDGKVWAKGEVEKGAVFYFTIS
ncbi:MAG: response regulator [Pseudomonadota bacterium]